ncbi:hypothetical protein P255_02342 [Acinetobacter brisouii CIP 110357]|uniref:Uncharacterized protein n=1 Tax=Acinetobacter brisouii CIP 110357 TaxID=1341683 RepID=V2UP01_9GAMM|nr:super-infection exclusion protein B [Acinetobacter brisouii]ENV47063.1 hypothetical protein F954_01859 [Acinetobacter brisouii ANC 4119]ESK50365.1 hypothetical protein P255_02342 [Acinetobacter brisouii CIP 110357]
MDKAKLNLGKYNYVFFIFLILLFITANIPQVDQNLSNFILIEYRTILILLALASLSFILLEVFQDKIQLVKEERKQIKQSQQLKDKLKSLNYDEKYILSLFMSEQKTEKALNSTNPNVVWLENMKFIINTLKTEENKKVFRIDPVVMNELRKNPNLLY